MDTASGPRLQIPLIRKLQSQGAQSQIWGYLFILPSLIFFAIFVVLPLYDAFNMSLYRSIERTPVYIGFDNYIKMFQNPVFTVSLANTFKYVLLVVPVTLVVSLVLASVIIDKHPKLQTFFRAAFYLPAVISVVSVGIVWRILYNMAFGLLNYGLGQMGAEPVNWLGNPDLVIFSLSFVIITFTLGQPIILFLAALGGIPQTYYEAAEIDGAGAFKKFIKITVPLAMPTTLFVLTTSTINAFQTFAVINLMTGGGPNHASSSLLFLIYKTAFVFNDFHMASAMGVILFLCVVVVGVIQFTFLSRFVEY